MPENNPSWASKNPTDWDRDNWSNFSTDQIFGLLGGASAGISSHNVWVKAAESGKIKLSLGYIPSYIRGFSVINPFAIAASTVASGYIGGDKPESYFNATVQSGYTYLASKLITQGMLELYVKKFMQKELTALAARIGAQEALLILAGGLSAEIVIPIAIVAGIIATVAYYRYADDPANNYNPYNLVKNGAISSAEAAQSAGEALGNVYYTIKEFLSAYNFDEHVKTTDDTLRILINDLANATGLSFIHDIPGLDSFGRSISYGLSLGLNFLSLPEWFVIDTFFRYKPVTPLVIDLDGDGIHTIGINDSIARFEMIDGKGLVKTGWIGKGDGLLAIDYNNNNKIDNIKELFGGNSGNGFEDLRKLDSNNDGMIDNNDEMYDRILVWEDINSNGAVEEGELNRLTKYGISSVSLHYSNIDVTNNGNHALLESTAMLSNGRQALVQDIWFEVSNVDKTYILDDSSLSPQSLRIPDLKGWGDVHDLRHAADNSPPLLDESANLYNSVLNGGYIKNTEIREFLYIWSNANLGSRNNYDNYPATDIRKVETLERFYGKKLVLLDKYGFEIDYENITGYIARQIDYGFSRLSNHVANAFFIETIGNELSHKEGYELDSNLIGLKSFVYYDSQKDRIYADIKSGLKYVASHDYFWNGNNNEMLGRIGSIFAEVAIQDGYSQLSDIEYYMSDQYHIRETQLMQVFEAYFESYRFNKEIQIPINGVFNQGKITAFVSDFNNSEPNDAYIYFREYGDVFLHDGYDLDDGGLSDTLYLVGLSLEETNISISNRTVVLSYKDNGLDRYITIFGQGSTDQYGIRGIDKFIFSDTSLTMNELRYEYIKSQITDGDDIINGTVEDDVVNGGKGDDFIEGRGGNDTFIYKFGDGNDVVITSHGFSPAGNNVLRLSGIESSMVAFVTDGLNLYVSIVDSVSNQVSGIISLMANKDYFNDPAIRSVLFDDGTVISASRAYELARAAQITDGSDEITGTLGPDIMRGGKGDDHLAGGTGVDTYVYARGDGNDIVDDGLVFENNNLVLHGITVSEMKVAFVGYDVVVSFAESDPGAGDAGSIRFRADDYWHAHALGTISFDDGTVLSPAQWASIGQDNANVFHAGDGDRIVDVRFTDTAVHGFLLHGYTPEQVNVTGIGYLGQITLAMTDPTGKPEKIQFEREGTPPWQDGVDQIQFDSGAVWTRDDLRYKAFVDDGTHGSTVTLDTAIYTNQTAFVGGTGDTIYIVGAGMQPVSIADHGGTNALTLRGVSQAQVDFSHDAQSDELVVAIHDVPGRSDSVVKFAHGLDSNGLAAVNFDDGTMTAAEIQDWIDNHHLAA